MANHKQEKIDLARDILRGLGSNVQELYDLAEELKELNVFGYARRLLAKARSDYRDELLKDSTSNIKFAQRHALNTYKDPDLPAFKRLEQALEILEEVEDLGKTKNQETLGLAGSIHKRFWQVSPNKEYLEISLAYYMRGYLEGPEKDFGYTGINAAFVLDLLSHIEEQSKKNLESSFSTTQENRDKAKEIRRDIIATLPPLLKIEGNEWLEQEWWFYSTLAEAYLGIQDFENARARLRQGKALPNTPAWELESTAKQLASLVQVAPGVKPGYYYLAQTEGWNVISEFLDNNYAACSTVFSGKFGIGLSGGGFRASLYHIGVLARLAELDLLRHVHVLSCVSGGSIVGAYYYLEVRKLLEEKADGDIRREDYIRIVENIASNFLAGVQKNVRTRVAINPLKNFKMLFSPNYSRTDRVGELYESELYSRIEDAHDHERYISDLFINPKKDNGSEEENFNPKRDNWKRKHKVPMLVLNATTLNTGHNWQFTASWMGESPFSIDTEIDGNWRYRRMYYKEAPEQYKQVRLGKAVGASACVPGLFPPVSFSGLYPEEKGNYEDMTVRLVDGGVHDNQGISSLLEQDCSVLFISDASGQMNSRADSGGGSLLPVMRMSSALMSRVRQAQFADLKARKRASLLKDLVVIHMKKGLDVDPISWKECIEPADIPFKKREPLLEYGVLRETQNALASIRTDLDSFCEVEAFSLMASGYLMAKDSSDEIKNLEVSIAGPHDWDFLAVEDAIRGKAKPKIQRRFNKIIKAGSALTFRGIRLSNSLKVFAALLVGALAAGIYFALPTIRDWLSILEGMPIWGKVVFWITLVIVAGPLILSGLAYIHIKLFDNRFIKMGSVETVLGKKIE